jgi:hypothetical protein
MAKRKLGKLRQVSDVLLVLSYAHYLDTALRFLYYASRKLRYLKRKYKPLYLKYFKLR